MASQNKTKIKKRKEPKYIPEYKCKRCKKSHNMWIEQLLLKVDKLKLEIEELRLTVNYIKDFLSIKDKEKANIE
jgi:hypothetical protein